METDPAGWKNKYAVNKNGFPRKTNQDPTQSHSFDTVVHVSNDRILENLRSRVKKRRVGTTVGNGEDIYYTPGKSEVARLLDSTIRRRAK